MLPISVMEEPSNLHFRGLALINSSLETSKASHGAGGSAVHSAVGGTLPFAMVLNQCQKAGGSWGHSARGSPAPVARLV